jgi:lysozyme family protein
MRKKAALLKGLDGVQAATATEAGIWATVRQAHLDNPTLTMKDICNSAMANLGLTGVSVNSIMSIYYRLERHFHGQGYAEDDTANQPQNT